MSPKYTSLEDGQVIVTDEPRADLDALARWERDDSPITEPQSTVPASTTSAAGPVNTEPVTGGNPPLLSTTAGVASPTEELSAEEAQRKAAEDLGAGANGDTGDGDASTPDANTEPERPGLNGSTEEWLAFAKHDSIRLDIADDAGRDDIVAAYIDAKAPAGNAGKDAWAAYADTHGVTVNESDGRDKIRAAVVDAGWAKA